MCLILSLIRCKLFHWTNSCLQIDRQMEGNTDKLSTSLGHEQDLYKVSGS